MEKNPNLLTAVELASLFGVSVATVYRHLEYGPTRSESVDLRKLPCTYVGRRRFWFRQQAEELLHKGL